MSRDFEAFHGIVLRSIIVSVGCSVAVEPFNRHGRLDAYVFDSKVGVFVKYSTKRMTPWPFTFHIDQVSELLDLEIEHPNAFVVFACGVDGLVAIEMATLHELVDFKQTEQAWVRIERRPRMLYSLSGNRGELANKVPRGIARVVEAIRS
jgi:hypothetical protein